MGQRLVSAAILVPIVLAAVKTGGWFYNAFVVVAATIGMFEWVRLTAPRSDSRLESVAALSLWVVLMTGWFFGPLWGLEVSVLAVLVLFYFAQDLMPGAKGWISKALWVTAGLPYLALAGLALIWLRADRVMGFYALLYLLAVVWGTDVGAYAAGRLIGGPKLCPKVSPNKTWAGLLGGMICAALAAYAVAKGFGDDDARPEVLFGSGLAVVSQAGDFFESYVKRRVGAKDSGTLIPGHGGLLDRIDGLLWAAPVLALALLLWGNAR